MHRTIALAGFLSVTAGVGVALAYPCEGRLPSRAGETFTGIVCYIGDGDSLCVGRSTDPATWIDVRMADFDAPELREPDGRRSRDLLVRTANGRAVICTAERGRNGRAISHDRVIATCRLNGQRIGDLLRDARAPEGGN